MKKMSWLSVAISSFFCILFLFFPIPLAYLIHSLILPLSSFAFLVNEAKFFLFLVVGYAIVTLMVFLSLSLFYVSSKELRENVDNFFLILSQVNIREVFFLAVIFILLVLTASITRFKEWSLVLMISLLVFLFNLSLLKLKEFISKPETKLPDLFSPDIPEDVEKVDRTYLWRFYRYGYKSGGYKTFKVEIPILISLLKKFREKERKTIPPYDNWKEYPTTITPEVQEFAKIFRDLSKKNGFYKIDEIVNVLCMIQEAISYSYDEDSAPNHEVEYPRYPIETLYDLTGDCECKTFLASSLLTILGYQTALLFYPGHVALGIEFDSNFDAPSIIYNGRRFFYYETTSLGWFFGVIPEEIKEKEPEAVVTIEKEEIKFENV